MERALRIERTLKRNGRSPLNWAWSEGERFAGDSRDFKDTEASDERLAGPFGCVPIQSSAYGLLASTLRDDPAEASNATWLEDPSLPQS